jgi:hypothetical protein
MTTEEKTLSVPEAAQRYFNIKSYAAARWGDIPTIRIGRRVRVPVRTLERMLDAVKPQGERDA